MSKPRGSLAVLVVALGLLVGSAVLAAEGWSVFSSYEGRFSVMLPDIPRQGTSTIQTLVGPVVEHSFGSTSQEAGFTVSYTDLPAVALLAGGRQGIYDQARLALLDHVDGQQVAFLALKVAKRQARVLTYTLEADSLARVGRTWFVLVGRRLYVVDATMPAAMTQNLLDGFFASLHIWDKEHIPSDLSEGAPERP